MAEQEVRTLQVKPPLSSPSLVALLPSSATGLSCLMKVCSAGALRNQEFLRSLHAQQGKQALQSVRSRQGTAVYGNSMGWQSSRYRAARRVPEAGSGSVFSNI